MKKLLFYGGAFDPPHLGHARLLEAAVAAVQPDLTLVIPTGVSPHKARSATPYWERFAMARACFEDKKRNIRVSGIEATGHRCYTFETVKRLKKRYPGYELYMLIGSDMVTSFPTWHLYRRLLSAVTVAAGCRDDDARRAYLAAAKQLQREGGKFLLLQFEPVEVSSTALRRSIAAGEGAEAARFLAPAVAAYIGKRGLYEAKKA